MVSLIEKKDLGKKEEGVRGPAYDATNQSYSLLQPENKPPGIERKKTPRKATSLSGLLQETQMFHLKESLRT